MHLSRALLWWYFRSAWFVTLPAALLAATFAIGYGERLSTVYFLPASFIFVHSVLVAWATSRFDTPAAAFVYTRGFTCDRLWLHRIASHLLCVVAAWVPASLIIWLGVRSAFQDHVIQNAYYPIFARDDYGIPIHWLIGYVLLLGAVEYAPIRRAQPTRDRDAGYALLVGVFFAAATLFSLRFHATWYAVLTWSALTTAGAALIFGSWRLHREIEVHP